MADDSHPFESQVGGHPGLRTSADGSQIIKPCLHSERLFYETVISGHLEGFRLLSKHVPTFLGVTVDAEGHEGLVLENVSNAFKKPNILDIKLGTVLYDDSATEEKKQRMIKAAKETTSLDTGVRITGFQVYDATTDSLIHTPKPYGRALTVARLPEATARFFPIKTPIIQLSSHLHPKKENPDNLGQNPQKDNVAGQDPNTSSLDEEVNITPSPAGTRPELLLPVLKGVLAAVRDLSEAVAKTEMRMIAGSVLIIYEGDELALEHALSIASEQETAPASAAPTSVTDSRTSTTLTQSGSTNAGVKVPPAYAVKLIDFAHTKLQEGLGPDEGALFGLRTVVSLLEGRIKEVQEVIGSSEDVS